MAILLLDPANPRSVAFQLGRLAEDLDLVGVDRTARVVREVAAMLGAVNPASLDEVSRDEVRDLVDRVAYDLRGISRDVRRDSFIRVGRPTLLAPEPSPGVVA